MNYGDLKTQFQGLLNRRDITPSLVTTFMGMGIQRIQRDLRVPSMEASATLVPDVSGNIALPADHLETISLLYTTAYKQTKLVRRDLETVKSLGLNTGDATSYCRVNTNLVVAPLGGVGTYSLNYYQQVPALVADSDTNWLTVNAPDLLIYAALTYAADYYLDERAQKFEQRFGQIGDALNLAANQNELDNASITPQWSGCDY